MAMKLLITGDLHLTDKKPVNRIDNYAQVLLNKFGFVLDNAEDCEAILQPMDFFDAPPQPSYDFFSKIYDMVETYQIPILTGFGQHDMRYRNTDKTALSALAATCGYLKIVERTYLREPDICISFASYGKEIPEPVKNHLNILVAHRMVVAKKLWHSQTEFVYGEDMLNKFPGYKLMIIGDNHQNFVIRDKNRTLINAGSMMRSNTAQLDHQPKIYKLEISRNLNIGLEEIRIPIQPAEEVFDVEKVITTKERDDTLNAFISGIADAKSMDLQGEAALDGYLEQNGIDQDIVNIIQGAKER